MSALPFRAEGVILSCVDYGESDRVVTLLTRERGRVAAFAAGARRSKRRFAGALEPFHVLQLELSERRGDLLFLSGCSVVESHAGLRIDLPRIAHAGHAAELCKELCREREPNEPLYEALVGYLGKLARHEADPSALLAFELAVLAHVGVAPRVDACAICGGPVGAGAIFDVGHGGAVCAGCSVQAWAGAVPVDGTVLEAMAALQTAGPFGATISDERVRARVRALVRRFTHQVLGRHPRSLDFLAQVGIEG